ncbi:MAG: BatD family protein, partial [Rhodothermia bacterium]|nr:BatD family protein [Rhodothermia bacterium]
MAASFATCVVLFTPARAQDVSVQASVNESTIGTEDAVTYTIQISGRSLPDITTPQPPQTRGLVLTNRFPFTSQNMSIVNGRVEQSVGYSWTFRPAKEGEAAFLPMEVEVDGKSYTTREIKVSVVPQSQRPSRPTQRRNPFLLDPFGRQQPAEEREITDRDMFIRAVPNKRTAYQNEQITIEYSLYFRSGIQLRQSRLADSWDAEGFWREELEIESRPVPKSTVVDGLRYNMITLKRAAVFPTRTGQLKIDPLRIESEASLPFGSGDPFFSLRNRYQPVRLSSPSIPIEVKAWPANPPATFNGAVGDFQLGATADRTSLDVGESLQVTIRVEGTGNISTIEAPLFRVPGAFEAYDPEVNVSVSRSGRYVRGSKTFTYVLVPRANGQFEIPALEFTFFDPSAESYVTRRSEPIPISVSGTADPLVESAETPAGLPLDDIAPIMDTEVRWKPVVKRTLYREALPYLVLGLPLLALLALRVRKAQNDKLSTDVRYARNRRAHPLAKRHLRQAEELLKRNEATAFYEELEKAALGFIGNRLNISELGLTREQLITRLRNEGLTDATADELRKLLEECDRGRFAPVPSETANMQAA